MILEQTDITVDLVALVKFWPDAGEPARRWACMLCPERRQPRVQGGVEEILETALAHLIDVHHVRRLRK